MRLGLFLTTLIGLAVLLTSPRALLRDDAASVDDVEEAPDHLRKPAS